MYSKLLSLDMGYLRRPGVIKVVQDGSFVGVLATSQQSAWKLQSGQEAKPSGKLIQQLIIRYLI